MKWLSKARLGQIASLVKGDISTLARAVAEAFDEAYENMGGIDQRVDALSSLYVEGTQAQATNAWAGELPGFDALHDGLTIDYYLPHAGTADPATLTLALKDGTLTKPVPVYRDAATPVTGQFAAGSILRLTHLAGSNRWQHSAISDVAISLAYDADGEALRFFK